MNRTFLKAIFCFFCLAIFSGEAFAQTDPRIETYEKQIKQAGSDSLKAHLLCDLASLFMDLGDPKAKTKLDESLRLTEDYRPERWSSQTAYKRVKFLSTLRMGHYQKRSGNYPEAIQFYTKAHEIAVELGQKFQQADAIVALSTVYGGYLQDFDTAIKYLLQAGEIWQELKFQRGLLQVYGNLGANFFNKGDHAKGIEYTLKTEKIALENGQTEFVGQIYSTLMSMMVEMDSMPQALVYAEKARAAFEIEKDMMRYADHKLSMSNMYSKSGDFAAAEKHAQEALDISLKDGFKFLVKDAYLLLQEIYLERAKTAAVPALKDSFFLRAFYFNKKEKVFADSLFNSEKSKQIAELNVKFETEKKEREISQLNAQAKDREIELLRGEVALRQAKIMTDKAREKALLLENTNANYAFELEKKEISLQKQNAEAREKQSEIEALNAENRRRESEAASERKIRGGLLAGLALLSLLAFLLLRLYLGKKKASEKIEQQRAEIEAQNAELAEANRFKSIFLSNMSHEIRTPLNTIIGMSGLLAASPVLPEKERDQAQIVRHASENLLTLINEILDFSKIEAGKVEFYPKPFGLLELLDRMVNLLSFQAAQKKLSLKLNASPGLPRGVFADAGRLNQILLNLLSNAVKFTERGEVSLDVSVRETLMDGRVLLRFSVRDTGIGISPEELPLIFDAFKQAGETTHLQHGGTGLGLAITKQLVVLQGGQIEAESQPGKGSTFTVLLPVELAELPKTDAKSAQTENVKLPSRKILLVEDNHFNQLLATELFQKLVESPNLAVAQNGQEAVDKALGGIFDLIFMDIKMPIMDGFAATRALRESGLRTPIIALTANATAAEREKCFAAGMDDYLSKPIEVDLLRNAMVKWGGF